MSSISTETTCTCRSTTVAVCCPVGPLEFGWTPTSASFVLPMCARAVFAAVDPIIRPRPPVAGNATMPDPFVRELDTVNRALVMACSRRARAIAKRDQAARDLANAQRVLEAAEMQHATCERHVDLCDKQINELLDERLMAERADQIVSA